MNTLERSKKEAVKVLESFKWTPEQRLVLEVIAETGFIKFNYTLLCNLFGWGVPPYNDDTETQIEIALLWDVDYNNGRKLFRKRGIGFLPLI